MGIKLKNRDPKFTDFASNDIVINHKEGTLFIKSDTEVKKLSEGGGGSSGGNVTLAGTPDYITISNQEITRNQIDLANDVTGVLPSANLAPDTAHLSVDQTFTGKKTFNHTEGTVFDTHITASGDISASGDVYSSNIETLWAGSFEIQGTSFVSGGPANADGIPANQFWYGPNNQGVNYYYWNNSYGNDSVVVSLTNGASFAHAGIIVPYKCVLIGFKAVISNTVSGENSSGGNNKQTTVALYTADGSASAFDDTTDAAPNLTLTKREEATTIDNTNAGANGNPMKLSVTNGTTILNAGDMIYPRVKPLNTAITSPESVYGSLIIFIQRTL